MDPRPPKRSCSEAGTSRGDRPRMRGAVRAAGATLVLALVTACTGDPSVPTPPPRPTAEVLPGSFAWSTFPELNTPRTEVSAAQAGGRLYVAGGFIADGSASAVLEAIDPASDDEWQDLDPLPEPLHHTALVAASDDLYLIGGYGADGAASDRAWRKRPGTGWERLPDLPEARGAHAAALVGDRIHVVGGATSFGGNPELVSSHHVLDTGTAQWSEASPLPAPRDHLAAASPEGSLYVLAGRSLSLDSVTDVTQVFEPGTGDWTAAGSMTTARGGFAAAAWRGMVVVAGGEISAGTIAEVEAFDPGTGRWRSLPDLPTPRHGLGVAALGEDLFVLGGGPDPGLTVSGVVEVLRAEP